ncbi:MAG: PKD domain-containing protein, partial [Candidatus Thermoplasmatota archaeon]|nr:PKD domain-containing protein [Candidatus Thermoplasmatota archaeon]
VLALVLLLSILSFPTQTREGQGAPGREVSFEDVGSSKFDQTSAPTFISVGDWNGDGYQDLLFNGYRLFVNSGPPSFAFTLETTVFTSSTSGARNGAWADWDGDGDLDLYQGCAQGTPDRFWENQGAPDFELKDISTDVFNFWQNLGPNTGNAWADFDRDGDLDLYVGNGEDWNDGNPIYFEDYFLRNENGVRFTDISSTVGIQTGENFYSRGASWGDLDNDRWPDLYVSHYRIKENHLFVNGHDGTLGEEGVRRNCSGTYDPTWYHDTIAGSVYGQNLWGPMWGHTIGSAWADFNRDGDLDLWTSDFVHKYVGYIGSYYDIRGYICDDGNLYINDGAPCYSFTDHRNTSGIPIWPTGGSGVYRGDQTFSGVTVGDYDNDGWEDMYIPQVYGDLPYTTPHLYHNRGSVEDGSVPHGTRFEDLTDTMRIKGANTYACMFLDHDNDGDLDLITGGGETWDGSNWKDYRVRLYENRITGSNFWLKLKLNGEGLNKDAVGARAVVKLFTVHGDVQMHTREVRAGTGHAHQDASVLHFGLGDLPLSDSFDHATLTVYWPDGKVQEIILSGFNQLLEIDRPEGYFPYIDTVTVSPTIMNEDSTVSVTVDAGTLSGSPLTYRWDTDSDNIWDHEGPSDNITFPVYQGGMRHLRCLAIDASGLGVEAYPIEIDVKNLKPEVLTESYMIIEMDSILSLPEDRVKDTPSDLVNLTWEVDWGDGSTLTGTGSLTGDHSYSIPGNFRLRITVEDEEFKVEGETRIEVLNVAPWGYVQPVGGNDTTRSEDTTVELFPVVFDTPSDIGDISVRWDFGDGEVQELWMDPEPVYHRYEDNGVFTVKAFVMDQYEGIGVLTGSVNITNKPPSLKVKNGHPLFLGGDEDEYLDFGDIFQGVDTASDILLLRYRWDFGDGNATDWTASPDTGHVYERDGEYDAVVSVMDDDRATAEAHLTVKVSNVDPEIVSISGMSDVFEDEVVSMTVEGRDTPSDRDDLVYTVDLDDGRTLQGSGTFEFSYPASGYYAIHVQVVDDDGGFSGETIYLDVRNMPPDGRISASSTTVDEDDMISLGVVDLSDSIRDLPNLTITWDLDDGTDPLRGHSVNHTYTEKGRYTVKMTIDDGDEKTVREVDVIVNNPVPVAVLEASVTEAETGTEIFFTAVNSSDNPSDIPSLLYLWDFDDGEDAEGKIVSHSFGRDGTYNVRLEVMDDDGSTAVDEITIVISGGSNGPVEPQGSDGVSTITLLLILVILLALLIILLILAAVVVMKRRKDGQQLPTPPMAHPAL